MKPLLAALALLPSLAFAQIQVDVQLPQVHFEVVPPVVQVDVPGVQVVQNYQEEVFFVDGFYWVQRDGRWFRSKDHRGNWVVVEHKVVPVTIVQLPRGKYKHWKGGPAVVPASHHDKHHKHDKHDKKDEHHDREHKGGKHKGKK